MEQEILAGAEPFRFEGNSVGVLVSHGFTGTTQSIRPLGEALASEGFTVAGPRLEGHGTSIEDHARSTAEGWIRSVEEDLAWLEGRCDSVFFAGLSMGGTLALYFGATRPELIKGVVPINACAYLANPDLAAVLYGRDTPPVLPGVGSDIKLAGVEELAYPGVAVPAAREFAALLNITRDLLPWVSCPALVIQSREDHVVPPGNGPFILDAIASNDKELVWLDDSYHVATLDNDALRIADLTTDFIKSLTQG
ncbi:MAG: alpha/beta hydrolase [Rubrobacter sp.]